MAFVLVLAGMEFMLTGKSGGCPIGNGMCPKKNSQAATPTPPAPLNANPAAPGLGGNGGLGAPGGGGAGGFVAALPKIVQGVQGLIGGGGGGGASQENTTPFTPGAAPAGLGAGAPALPSLPPIAAGPTLPLVPFPTPPDGLTAPVPLAPALVATPTQNTTPSAPAAEVTVKDKDGNSVPVVKIKTGQDPQGNTVIDETTSSGQTIEIKESTAPQSAAAGTTP